MRLQHGQRCAQFMRGVGDEVATHLVEAFLPGDVAGQQQVLLVAIRHNLEHHFTVDPDGRGKRERFVEPAVVQVDPEIRVADKVGDRLPRI